VPERVESGLSEGELTFTISWDRWKEDKIGIKQSDQGYKALADPSNPGFKNIELQSLMLLYGSFSEIDRYASSAPPDIFNQFAQRFRQAFLALNGMRFHGSDSFELFSGGIRKLAAAYRLRGDDRTATEFYTEEIDRCQKAGATAQLARTMDGFGVLLAGQGKLDAAERLFHDSLTLRQKSNLADEVRSWMLLAGLQALKGSAQMGEDALAQAMARLPEGRVNFLDTSPMRRENDLHARQINALAPINELAWQLQAEGQYASADRIMSLALVAATKWLDTDDLRMAHQRKLAGCCAYAAGRRAAALKLLQEANDSGIRYLRSTTWPLSYEAATDCVVRLQGDGTFSASFGTTEELAQELIEQKGYAFEQELEKRQLLARTEASPIAKELWQKLVRDRTTYRDQLLAGHIGDQAGLANESDVISGEAKLASALGAPLPDSASSLARLTAALPEGSAYVDYTLCDRWTEKISFNEEWCAVVVQPGRPPSLARCGSLQTVRPQIDGYLWLAQSGDSSDSELASASQALYSSLIEPVEKLLAPDAKTVFLCLDGPLASIGLAALLDESGHFWCEKRELRYVTDGSAMLKSAPEVPLHSDRVVGLLASPLFDAASPKANSDLIEVDPLTGLSPELRKKVQGLAPEIRKEVQRNMDQLLKRAPKPSRRQQLEPLPGALDEVKALQALFNNASLNVVTLLGADATETRFKSLRPCLILHMATHADFIKEIPSHYQSPLPIEAYKITMKDITGVRSGAETSSVGPMMRSFLALAGAQTTLNQWDQGNFPNTVNDGLLMADEVMDMDFSHTLLVTLSGCGTGRGASVRAEGSVGIQRAFLIAGARYVLATLWPIQDVETVDLMKAFYTRVVQAGEAPPAALSATQRELLVRRRRSSGLATAVYLTAPFILTSASP
jgi:CHAT domain-containing protein